MTIFNIPNKKENLNWDYDERADVLYLSIGKPKKAVGLDAGDGVIVRYQEKTGEIVGVTILRLKERCISALAGKP